MVVDKSSARTGLADQRRVNAGSRQDQYRDHCSVVYWRVYFLKNSVQYVLKTLSLFLKAFALVSVLVLGSGCYMFIHHVHYEPVTAPTGISDGEWGTVVTQSPVISYNAGTSEGAILGHKLRIIKISDESVVLDWIEHTSGTAVTGLSLTHGQSYRAEVKAIGETRESDI